MAVPPDPWQRTDIAARTRLAQQLAAEQERLRQRYAGSRVAEQAQPGGPTVLAGQMPGQPFSLPPWAAGLGLGQSAAAPVVNTAPVVGSLDKFHNTIDSLTSGIWGPGGERLIPNDPSRPPGPIGRGPGYWLQDWGVAYNPAGTGSMTWRNDWVPAPPGDPRGWLISGET